MEKARYAKSISLKKEDIDQLNLILSTRKISIIDIFRRGMFEMLKIKKDKNNT